MPGLDSRKAQGMRAKYEARNLEKFGKGNTISGGYKRKKLSEKEKDAAKTAKKVANTARLRKIGKKEKYGSLSEKNAAEMMAAKKKPTVKKSGVGTLSDKKTRPVQGRGVGTLNEKRTRPVQGRGVGTLNDKRTRPTGDAKLNRAKSDNKRGMTKAQSQALGLTGDAGRKAAVKLRADKKTQSDAVAAEAKRKVAEKKKTDKVDTAAAIIATTAIPALRALKGKNAVKTAKTVKPTPKKLPAPSKFKRIEGTAKEIKTLPKPQKKLPAPTSGGRNRVKAETTDRIIKAGGKIDRRKGKRKSKGKVTKRTSEMTMKDLGFRKGGLVKGIDGIAMRGKTKATRSK